MRVYRVRMVFIFFTFVLTRSLFYCPIKNQTVFKDGKIYSFMHLLHIRKLNPFNLKKIALSFGSFNRMNYGQTNWTDNNLMCDINFNSTRKLTSFSWWKMGASSLSRVRMALRKYNRQIRKMRYVKWNFGSNKIVINHQNKFTHTLPRTNSTPECRKSNCKGRKNDEMHSIRDMPLQTNSQRYKRSNK